MLLHSREGSGEHRLVDVGAIIEEALGVAQGVRQLSNLTTYPTVERRAPKGCVDQLDGDIREVVDKVERVPDLVGDAGSKPAKLSKLLRLD
jgi:hypothetical protein